MIGGNGTLGLTQTAGTLIQFLIPPRVSAYTHITDFQYTDGGSATPHVLTWLRPLGRTTCVGAAAAGQAAITIVNDPGNSLPTPDPMVSNDYVAIRETDGITRLYQFSSAVSLTAVTLTTNLVVGTANGATFWMFGVTTDTDQRTNAVHPNYTTLGTGVTLNLASTNGGGIATVGVDEPILFSSSNPTHAGTLNLMYFSYSLS